DAGQGGGGLDDVAAPGADDDLPVGIDVDVLQPGDGEAAAREGDTCLVGARGVEADHLVAPGGQVEVPGGVGGEGAVVLVVAGAGDRGGQRQRAERRHRRRVEDVQAAVGVQDVELAVEADVQVDRLDVGGEAGGGAVGEVEADDALGLLGGRAVGGH